MYIQTDVFLYEIYVYCSCKAIIFTVKYALSQGYETHMEQYLFNSMKPYLKHVTSN